MPAPFVPRGRVFWTAIGKRNGLIHYRWLQRLDNMKDGDSPTLDMNYQAVSLAVRAIQSRLKAVGYTGPLTVNDRFGSQTRDAVVWFQKQQGFSLKGQDGIVGPATSRALWRELVEHFSGDDWAPAEDVWGTITVESAFDPGAVSGIFDPAIGPDWGLGQISHQHITGPPRLTIEQAFDPTFAINYIAGRHAAARAQFNGKGPDLQRNCSLAHYNNPKAAGQWYAAGSPPTPKIAAYVGKVREGADTYP